ncbi:MAG: SMI1/KNR4 family protein [Clostridium sp.]|nr:SMI1/KNR4 family protein [Clostridium sp.]
MMNELYELLKKHEERGDFTHAVVTEEILNEAENRLGIKIPEEYKYFLKEFGHGGIGGIEVIGIGKNDVLVFEKETLKYRAYGLPDELIVIENCDEWLYCINSIDGKVVMWSNGNIGYAEKFDSFDTYLYDRVNDILENM